jgi:uncharacterized protein (DUF2141 family)
LQFFNLIGDFNENNKITEYNYVFSTGNYIDSLGISGILRDAITLEPIDNKYVGIYSNLSDTAAASFLPDFVTRTDTAGRFFINHISAGKYRLFALDDVNKNLIYDLPNETIAFSDSAYIPSAERILTIDSVDVADSLVPKKMYELRPSGIKLFMFKEDRIQQRIKTAVRSRRECVDFYFSKPRPNISKIELIDSIGVRLDFAVSRNQLSDSISIWLKPDVAKRDSLWLLCQYQAQDSNLRYQLTTDTLKAIYRSSIDTARWVTLRNNLHTGKLDIADSLYLYFPVGIDSINSSKISLYQLRDTVVTNPRIQLLNRAEFVKPASYRLWFAQKLPAEPHFRIPKSNLQPISVLWSADSTSLTVSWDSTLWPTKEVELETDVPNLYYNRTIVWQKQKTVLSFKPQTLLRNERPEANHLVAWFSKNTSNKATFDTEAKGAIIRHQQIYLRDSLRVDLWTDDSLAAHNGLTIRCTFPDVSVDGTDTTTLIKVGFLNKEQRILQYSRISPDSLVVKFNAPLLSAPTLDAKNFRTRKNWYEPYISADSTIFSVKIADPDITAQKNLSTLISYNFLNNILFSQRREQPITFITDSTTTTAIATVKKQATDSVHTKSYNKLPFSLHRPAKDLNTVAIAANFTAGRKYIIKIDSMSFLDYRSRYNDSISFIFDVRKKDDYGELHLTLENLPANPLLLLYNETGTTKIKDLGKPSSKMNIPNLMPGKYQIVVVSDTNANGYWDTGNYSQHTLPEKRFIYSKAIVIKLAWITDENWDLSIPSQSTGIPKPTKGKKR